jgi:hypothetical protein
LLDKPRIKRHSDTPSMTIRNYGCDPMKVKP